jgi:hypothetical protein
MAKTAALVSGVATLRPGRGSRRPPPGNGRLILHVGTHKTGTTSIQEALLAHSRELADQGVVYPNAAWSFGGDPRRSTRAAHFAFAEALADPSDRSLPRLEAFRDRLARALAASKTVVVSAESMYRHILVTTKGRLSEDDKRAMRASYVRRMAEFFDGFDPEVIVYFRRPDAFAESLYQEAAARAMVSHPFQRFVTQDAFRFDYAFQLELLRRHFPVHAFGFEAAAQDDLVDHFMAVLGARVDCGLGKTTLRASVPKRAAQWLVRHSKGARATHASRRSHRHRWLFALQAGHKELFAAPRGAGFWSSNEERDAFLSRSLAGFDAVDFPPAASVIRLPAWSREDDQRVEAAFESWELRNRAQLLKRELGRIPPYISPELG